MDFADKITELKQIISTSLSPLIDNDYIVLDCHYHHNLGDVLIWEGQIDFLATLPHKCLGQYSLDWQFPILDENVVIILTGGGNFGDLWRHFQEFKLKVIKHYPNNKIVIFPQSVWYESPINIIKDSELMAKHPNLTICARDLYSEKFLKDKFSSNNIILVPDLAFWIDDKLLDRYRQMPATKDKLFFKRMDKELRLQDKSREKEYSEVHDWPTMEKITMPYLPLHILKSLSCHFPILKPVLVPIQDFYARKYFRLNMVRKGCEFLSQYNAITTTRLHGLILSILLHKQVEFLDNSTKKISAFANTWLNDLEGIEKID